MQQARTNIRPAWQDLRTYGGRRNWPRAAWREKIGALSKYRLEIHDFGRDLALQTRLLSPLVRAKGLSLGDRACLM